MRNVFQVMGIHIYIHKNISANLIVGERTTHITTTAKYVPKDVTHKLLWRVKGLQEPSYTYTLPIGYLYQDITGAPQNQHSETQLNSCSNQRSLLGDL